MSKDKESKIEGGDLLHALIKGSVSAIPFVGGVLSEFYGLTVVTPLQKRQENWLMTLYQEIKELEKNEKAFSIESLQNNENFISVITETTRLAIKTHKKEKLDSLKNATLNSVTSKIYFDNQVVFLSYLDSFSLFHIEILLYIEKQGLNGISSSTDEVSDIYINGIDTRGYSPENILDDLFVKGLVKKSYINFNQSSKIVRLNLTLSDIGKEFLSYIRR